MKITLYSSTGWKGLCNPQAFVGQRVVQIMYPIGCVGFVFDADDACFTTIPLWGLQYLEDEFAEMVAEVCYAQPNTRLATMIRPNPTGELIGAQSARWIDCVPGDQVWLDHHQNGKYPHASPRVSGPYTIIHQVKRQLRSCMPQTPLWHQTFPHPHENLLVFPDTDE